MVRTFVHALEWDRLLQYAEKEARTLPARAALRALLDPAAWAGNLHAARHLQNETQEVTSLLERDGLWGPLTELEDPATALERLELGGVLELAELRVLRGWIHALDGWAQFPRDEIHGELFAAMLAALPDPAKALQIVDRILTPEGELSERASPKLGQINSDIRGTKREIQVVLDQLLRTFSQRGVLQENFSDIRDGRYVLPVKISSQNDVDGIIYEASVSRQTVFVEPREVSLLNNRLRRLQNDLIQEIYAILEATSRQLRPFQGELGTGAMILAHWDAVQARARIGRFYGGKRIQVTDERVFDLSQTVHPLLYWSLPREAIIRNDVAFGEPTRALLLTGPNTGGKTVLLKTLGLAGICARTGFPFPSSDIASVPFFETFFADLGDAQSIEAHISSFSGHILRFREILESFSDRSLVLLDELNTATDPEEGAALGRAFLETVLQRGAVVVSTTHDPHLKALALNDSRIVNASMAFDETARTPTYSLIVGVPGRSRALDTAARLGIPAAVLDLARSYLSHEHKHFETMLSKLESDVAEAANAQAEAVRARDDAEKLRREWSARTKAQVTDALDKTRQKLRHILEQAQEEVRSSVRKLEEMRTRREVDQARSGLTDTFQSAAAEIDAALGEVAPELAAEIAAEMAEDLRRTPPPAAPQAPVLKIGMNVRVPKWKSTGQILSIHGNQVKVALGALQMTLNSSEIEYVPPTAAQRAASARSIRDVNQPAAPEAKIDLRGIRRDEALAQLAQYLDQAYRSGAYVEVTVVHGLGTGAIREGARKMLAKLPYVKRFADGGAGRGGAGATIVEFERAGI